MSEAGRKRGRKSIAREDSDEEEAPTTSRSAKKAKKQTNNRRAESPELDAEPSSMNTYMHLSSWEDVVSSVDTVERTGDGKLFVYFTLYVSSFVIIRHLILAFNSHDGAQVKEPSEVCKSRFPVKVCPFHYMFFVSTPYVLQAHRVLRI